MPSNTTYNPPNINSFTKSAIMTNNQGITVTVPAGTSANLDITMTDDHLMTGAWFICNNGNYGDTVNFQVIDTAGIIAPPGTILNQFITNWYVPPTCDQQIEAAYPAKVFTGLTLRLVYTSTGENDVFIAVNYKLHKVLT